MLIESINKFNLALLISPGQLVTSIYLIEDYPALKALLGSPHIVYITFDTYYNNLFLL